MAVTFSDNNLSFLICNNSHLEFHFFHYNVKKKEKKQFHWKKKVHIIEAEIVGRGQVDVAKKIDIASSVLATILKEKDKILKLSKGSN